MSEEPLYVPSPWQVKFHSAPVTELLGAGAAGPGKTTALIMDPMAQIQTEHQRCSDPNHPYPLRWGSSMGWSLHLKREFVTLADTIARTKRIYPRIDPDAKWLASESMWVFSSGYRIQFGHCQQEDDWNKYYGSEYTHIGYDEGRMFTKEQFEQINSRLRTSDPVLRSMLRIKVVSNPGTCLDSHHPNWLREYFVDPAPQGNKILRKKLVKRDGSISYRTRMYLPATLYDNPDKAFVAQYEETLLSRPAHIRQQLLYGNWYSSVGSFFGDDWNPSLHVVEPFTIPADWPRFRAMDWGFKSNGVVGWFAMDYDGNLYCEREFSFRELTATQVARRIKEYEIDAGLWKDGRSRLTGPADTQLWEERGESAMSKAEEFQREGVVWAKADKKSRAKNAERLLARLKDHKNGTTLPGIMFFRNCQRCIQTIPVIMADPNDSEVPLKGGDDHWLDMVMYACAYASRGSAGIAMSRVESRDDDEDDRRERALSRSRGRYGYGY